MSIPPIPLYIGIGFDAYRPWNRRVLFGITRYAREHANWHMVFSGLATRNMPFFQNLANRVDGWIVDRPYVSLPPSIPQVVITPEAGDEFRAAVISDMHAIGAMAADALHQCGYPRAACMRILPGKHAPDDERHAGFLERAAELGMQVELLPSPLIATQHSASDDLLRKLHGLLKPAGIFAHNLNEAHALSFFIQAAHLETPNEIGLIVGGDDRAGLEALVPSVSGIDRNMELIGWQAAQQLDRLFRGEAVDHILRVPPLGVILRESTELDRSADPVIRKANKFIRDNLESAPSIDQIAEAAHVSPSSLFRRFRQCLGHTPAEEIRRQRLRKAMKLLRETQLSLTEVSARSGYAESSQLSRAIKQATGMTPKAFRHAAR